jgi:hypothetical protein
MLMCLEDAVELKINNSGLAIAGYFNTDALLIILY